MNQKFLGVLTAGWLLGIALGQTPLEGRALGVAAMAGMVIGFLIRSRLAGCFVLACLAAWPVGFLSLPPEDALIRTLASDVARCDIQGRLVERAGVFGTKAHVTSAVCERGASSGALGHVIIDGAPGEPGSAFASTGRFIPFGSDGFSDGRRRTGALAEWDALTISFAEPGGASGLAASIRGSAHRAVAPLDPRAGALSMGLVIGDTSGFDSATEDSFRRAGLSHLVAVSGSNVAIVLGTVLLLAARLPLHARTGSAAIALGMFVLVVGPEPSVLRAAAMGVIALLALSVGGRSEPLRALCLAGLFLTALRPGLVFTVGFWLSVLATVGIVLWARPLATWAEGVLGIGKWRTGLAAAFGVTCAAQFAVAPLLAIVFGELSVAGPLANLLAVPAVPPATILGFVAALLGTVAPLPAEAAATASEPFLRWILWIGDRFGSQWWSDVGVPPSAGLLLALGVAACAVITLRARAA